MLKFAVSACRIFRPNSALEPTTVSVRSIAAVQRQICVRQG